MSDQTVLKGSAPLDQNSGGRKSGSTSSGSGMPDAAFERKVRASALVLLAERIWPRAWAALAVVMVFIALSMLGLWALLPVWLHKLVLALLGIGVLAAIVSAVRVPVPTRDEAIRRMERVSGLPHRPASSYEDGLAGGDDQQPETRALWAAHRKRLQTMLGRLQVGRPEPRTDRLDPFALRAALLLTAIALTALVGDSARDRLAAAFRFEPTGPASTARIDAWVTPPGYTGKPPIMLADGSGATINAPAPAGGAIIVPAKSILVVRGVGNQGLKLEAVFTPDPSATADGAKPQAPATLESKPAATAGDAAEIKFELKGSGSLRATANGSKVGTWVFDVVPDQLPRITLTKVPEPSPRGSLKLTYKVEDDYGVASAEARFEKLKPKAADPSKAWAREELKGPRRPLERPPVMALRLPRPNARDGEAQTYLELGSHPWAGMDVRMTLMAKDVAGQTGKSATMDMVMPGRQFRKPLARAVIEQRRKLIDDTRYRGQVLRALAALTLAPENYLDTHVYLSLRDVYHRLQRDKTRAGMKSATDQLWHVALRIEDGDLSDAERALREAQDKLSKALENGASDQEIQQAMQEMRQALNNYLEQLQKQAEGQQPMPPGQDQSRQTMSSQDLDRMMKNIENMAKNGSREQAQQMLSEMRDLLERLQAGRMNPEQQQQSQQMMQKMDELGNIVGDQQKLMDETFNAQRRQQGEQQQRQQGQRGERGQQQGRNGQNQNRGERGQQQGQQGQGQQGQQGQGQQGQQGQNQQGQGQSGQGQLGQRQGALRDKLDQLQREMGELGLGSDKLDAAREAMGQAEEALRNGDLEGATAEQGEALEKLRDGARQMAQEMMKGMPQRYGQNGDSPRDPFGRPQRSQGPDLGTSVKVPEEIDMQRAREILEELRRRSGEATRPQQELDYLDRLLRRF